MAAPILPISIPVAAELTVAQPVTAGKTANSFKSELSRATEQVKPKVQDNKVANKPPEASVSSPVEKKTVTASSGEQTVKNTESKEIVDKPGIDSQHQKAPVDQVSEQQPNLVKEPDNGQSLPLSGELLPYIHAPIVAVADEAVAFQVDKPVEIPINVPLNPQKIPGAEFISNIEVEILDPKIALNPAAKVTPPTVEMLSVAEQLGAKESSVVTAATVERPLPAVPAVPIALVDPKIVTVAKLEQPAQTPVQTPAPVLNHVSNQLPSESVRAGNTPPILPVENNPSASISARDTNIKAVGVAPREITDKTLSNNVATAVLPVEVPVAAEPKVLSGSKVSVENAVAVMPEVASAAPRVIPAIEVPASKVDAADSQIPKIDTAVSQVPKIAVKVQSDNQQFANAEVQREALSVPVSAANASVVVTPPVAVRDNQIEPNAVAVSVTRPEDKPAKTLDTGKTTVARGPVEQVSQPVTLATMTPASINQTEQSQSLNQLIDKMRAGVEAARPEQEELVATKAMTAKTPDAMQQLNSLQNSLRTANPVQLQMPIGTPPNSQNWSSALADKVYIAASQNLRVVNIQLDPPELGALQIRLQISGPDQQLSASFTSPHAAVRDALEQQLPRLREMLAEQGIELGESSVSDQGGDNRQNQDIEGRSGSGDYADSEEAILQNNPLNTQGTLSLVDFYA